MHEHLWRQGRDRFCDYVKKVDSLKSDSERRLKMVQDLTRMR